MTVFEKFKSMNIDEYAEWFETNCLHNVDPCIRWWDETYCQNCEGIIKNGQEYAYCELNKKCRFFEDMDSVPDNRQMVKIWLESEAKNIGRECPDCRYFVGCETACGGKVCDMFVID